MKLPIILSFLSLALGTVAQAPITVEITGNIFNTKSDSVQIAQNIGPGLYKDLLKAKITKKGDFVLKGKLPAKDYYVFRAGNQHINLVLRDSSKIRINADASNLSVYNNITGSDESVALNEFVVQMLQFNQKRDSASAYIRRNPDQAAEINQSFQNEYFQFSSYRQKFISMNPNSPALLPVISTLDMDKEFSIYESLITQLNNGFAGSPSIENVKRQYEQLKQQKEAQNFLAPGKMAPGFTQNDVNGKPVSLSDLKGKVVLIDFWASWCGPCRKENPNVVKLYEKYKDAGFTVLSVSLDDNKTNWLAAIDKDKLAWPYHVSDLKKWGNEVARIYQVSGIPFTVLVDKEGKIIDTKLRGVELERALATIFGF
jgi:thiol-disulfide isomerase/thioredoxin